MLNNKGFNLWADNYDQTVQVREENNQYPFAGYKKILNTIYNEVMLKNHSDVLDIGFGTGVLTSKLYENGHQMDGIDFSSKMISIAKIKMPDANLIEWDISNGLPLEIKRNKYDSIISTYALHHLEDKEKILFINNLLSLLKKNGKLFIGDVSFQTREELEICRLDNIDYWDDDEFYFVYSEISASLQNKCHFYPMSHCGGVFIIENS
ncbi:putative methyltransferase [Paraliobacillus sp. PM-2]|uniref:class I SAM-dependent methyltransferase n=1 Tax=Paraliobacillus sp. PM-2 TaxID=1462524 RepID=UPI00061C5E04|nr:class I SAM-dependent methyltransferase [Paraliobacillus sp. PM-2]CQR46821.1 putative methyltransferase [Paraliobacillus sp. PM-2]